MESTHVNELVESYRRAAVAVDKLPSLIEREIGRTTLRQNSSRTLNHVATRAEGVSAQALAPLRQWVADYSGEGKRGEQGLNALDAAAQAAGKKVLKDATTWALAGNAPLFATGVFGTMAGIMLAIMDFGEQTTSSILAALAAGSIPGAAVYYAIRGSAQLAPVIASGVRTTWHEANTLGAAAWNALNSTSVPIEQRLWNAAGGSPYPTTSFVSQARLRAQIIVGSAIALAAFGVFLFLIGAISAVDEWSADNSGI